MMGLRSGGKVSKCPYCMKWPTVPMRKEGQMGSLVDAVAGDRSFRRFFLLRHGRAVGSPVPQWIQWR